MVRRSNLSYEVGRADLVDGLDDAIIGTNAGESVTFDTTLQSGDHVGDQAAGHRHRELRQGEGAADGRRRIRVDGE